MKWYNQLIKYRLWIGLVLIALGIYVNYAAGFWPAFPLYLVGLILLVSHFLFGPLRLIQEFMEEGDMEGAEKVLNSIKFPNLLIKPIRSVYFTLKGNMAMMKQDFDTAEKHIKKGTDLMGNSSLMQGQMKQAEGANKLQLGMLAMQKNDLKGAEGYIRAAIRSGLPDKESEAAAYLQMCSLMMNKREFRAAKEFFRKAKALKPTSAQIVDQIKQIEKYITRMPG
jgi:tetratricopeptide (TPR) repeat protein